MLVRTGYGKKNLQQGDLLTITFSDRFPTPVAITDSDRRRRYLHNNNIRYYSDIQLTRRSNAWVLTGKLLGVTEEVLTVAYTQPNIFLGTVMSPETEYFNYVDICTDFTLAIDFMYRRDMVSLLMLDCITNVGEHYYQDAVADELVFWKTE